MQNITFIPEHPIAEEPVTLHIALEDINGTPLTLVDQHERWLHTIIISEDFTTFEHMHPEDFAELSQEAINAARFEMPYVFPRSGTYLVALDFATPEGAGTAHTRVDVGGHSWDQLLRESFRNDTTQVQDFGAYTVQLDVPANIAAGAHVTLQYTISNSSGAVSDLEPYLAAAMHIAAVRKDLQHFQHTHGVAQAPWWRFSPRLPEQFGPVVTVHLAFPEPGLYHVFGEFQHQGAVTVTHFAVHVAELAEGLPHQH